MRFFVNKNKIFTLTIIGIFVFFAYFFGLSKIYAIRMLKLKSFDMFTYIKDKVYPLKDNINEVVIIKIDEHSFRRLKKNWPWPRSFYTAFLERITKANPRLICFDIFMSEKQDEAQDAELAKMMELSGNVMLTSYFDERGYYNIPNKMFADSAKAYGYVIRPRDMDYYIRRFIPVLSKDGKVFDYSFASKAAAYYHGSQLSDIKLSDNAVIMKTNTGSIFVPLRKDKTVILNYSGGLEKFTNLSFSDVLLDDIDASLFKDKVVIVGVTAEIVHDIYHTTIGSLPGVVIEANDIYSTIKGCFIKELPISFNIFLSLLLIFVTAFIAFGKTLFKGIVFLSAEIVLLVFAGVALLAKYFIFDCFSCIFVAAFTFIIVHSYRYIQFLIRSAKLKMLAVNDEATNLFSYSYSRLKLRIEYDRALIEGRDLSLVIADIAKFKQFKDMFGIDKSKVILKGAADTIALNSRKSDFVCCYDPDKFIIILLNTNQQQAGQYSEKINKKIKELKLRIDEVVVDNIELNFGIAGLKGSKSRSCEDLIEIANKCLSEKSR